MIRAIWFPALLTLVSGVVFIWVSYFALAPLVLMGLDTYGRYRDYRYLIGQTRSRRVLLFKHFKRSFCGRQVLIATLPSASIMLYIEGYRWYHVLPDYTFHPRKSPLRSLSFWKGLIGGYNNA